MMRRVVRTDLLCCDCGRRQVHARGLCKCCYQRRNRHGQNMPPKRDLAPGTYRQMCQRPGCGLLFKVRLCEVAKAKERGCSPPIYCSLACRSAMYCGDGNPKWRGGTYRVYGYVYEYSPDHPHATKQGYVMQHRLVVEREIGRFLDPSEEVHHKNHVRDDNRFENLEVQPDKETHRVRHAYYQTSACPNCGAEVVSSAAHRRRHKRKFCSRRCSAAVGSVTAAAMGPRLGEELYNEKLTDDMVRQIRIMSADGLTQRSIASQFGIAQVTVSKIVNGKSWSHVQ